MEECTVYLFFLKQTPVLLLFEVLKVLNPLKIIFNDTRYVVMMVVKKIQTSSIYYFLFREMTRHK